MRPDRALPKNTLRPPAALRAGFFLAQRAQGYEGAAPTVRLVSDPRIAAIPDVHGHAKGEHKPFAEERPIAYSARMLFLWFYHACRRGAPRFLMVADHINYLTFEDPAAVNLVRRALELAKAGDLYGAAETANVDIAHAAVVSEGLRRRGMRFSVGAEVDNDPRARPDAQNIVDAMRPDAMIRSVHFLTIEHPEKGAGWQWPFDNAEFSTLYEHVGVERTWDLYMASLLEAIEKLPGHIVGHFYAPTKFGHWPTRERMDGYEDRLIEAVAARGMAIELNTRFLYRENPAGEKKRYHDANLRLLKKARRKGIGIAVGTDAHSPKDQGAGFSEALSLLDAAGINELIFPIGGRLARVALRATEELLAKHALRTTVAPPPGSSISGFGRAELEAASPAKRRTSRASGSRRTPGKSRARKAASRTSAGKSAGHPRSKRAGGSKKSASAARGTRKAAARKTSSRKAVARKTTARKAARKAPARKMAARKSARKSLPARKKPAAKRPPARKRPASRQAAKTAKRKPVKTAKRPAPKRTARKPAPSKTKPKRKR